MDQADGDPRWTVLLPVKPSRWAKSGLSDLAGERRPELARALALDTLDAVLACPLVERIVLVGGDPDLIEPARERVEVWDGEPQAGLTAALRSALVRLSAQNPDAPVVILSADLPALRPKELAVALRAAQEHERCIVADAGGVGTTLYAAGSAARADPRFGGRSRAAHRAAGCAELDTVGLATVRRNVDSEVDLWDALRLGAGPHTSAVAAGLGLQFTASRQP